MKKLGKEKLEIDTYDSLVSKSCKQWLTTPQTKLDAHSPFIIEIVNSKKYNFVVRETVQD